LTCNKLTEKVGWLEKLGWREVVSARANSLFLFEWV